MCSPAMPGTAQAQSRTRGDTRPRLLVVQPDPLGVLDRFARWLTDANIAIRVVKPFTGEPLPDSFSEDALLVLGGSMSANEDDEYPWLADIRGLLRQAVDSARPTLGICLGGQLLAQSFGGTVTAGDRGVEAGVVRIWWRNESRTDPLFTDLPTPYLAGAMHEDMVRSLPGTAVWLAHSDLYRHQAFRVGAAAWGVQFHPEVSHATYRRWAAAATGPDADGVARKRRGAAQFERLDDDVAAANQILAERFADLVHTAVSRRRDRT